jgi:hypothetical protein
MGDVGALPTALHPCFRNINRCRSDWHIRAGSFIDKSGLPVPGTVARVPATGTPASCRCSGMPAAPFGRMLDDIVDLFRSPTVVNPGACPC